MPSRIQEIMEGTLGDMERLGDLREGSRSASAENIRRILQDAETDLARRLRGVAAPGNRFTTAQARAFQVQNEIVAEYLSLRLGGLNAEDARRAIGRSLNETISLLEGLEERFTGVVQPLRLRQAGRLSAVAGRAEQTMLRFQASSWDRYGAEMIGQMENLMARGIAQGMSMDDMIGALTGHGGPRGTVSMAARVTPQGVIRLAETEIPEGLFVRNRYWAERIVRTETTRAYNGARLEGMREVRRTDMPDMQKKIVAILDNRTAADSIAVNGQIRELDGFFVDGAGRTYQYPPARPNDRETVIPWRPRWTRPAREVRSVRDRATLGELTEAEQTRLADRAP